MKNKILKIPFFLSLVSVTVWFICFADFMIESHRIFGSILIIFEVVSIISVIISDFGKSDIQTYGCIKVFYKKDKDGMDVVYLLNENNKPLCGATNVLPKQKPERYLIGFSKDEKDIYSIDPKTGVGQKIIFNGKFDDIFNELNDAINKFSKEDKR